MTTIHIAASREYDVVIEPGLLTRLGTMAAELGLGRRAAVISDDAVFALYGAAAEKALTDAGFQVDHFLFPHGEQQKNLSTYGQVLNFLCDRRFTRSDFLVALGGGVVGDLAGFAAATYQRGVPYIQVPTTLLSMVDSSVGGKTAVDLEHGKNQAGCFYQPSLVLCDPSLLNTLPEREYRAGCAEIIKYAMLYSEDFLRELEETPVLEQFERVISVCVGMKRDVVRGDEFDKGQRALLNLGHTVGHAVEACSGFTLLHGEGVAIGMAIITRAAVEKGLCTPETLPRLLAVLERYGLPTETDYPLTDILAAAEADKKRTDDVTKFIVPERVAEGGRSAMIEILQPGFRTGAVHIPASKSQAHRLLICAALSQNETVIRCRGISRDIAATADCLNALGAEIWLRGGPDGAAHHPEAPGDPSSALSRKRFHPTVSPAADRRFGSRRRVPHGRAAAAAPLASAGSGPDGSRHDHPPEPRPALLRGTAPPRRVFSAGGCVLPIHFRFTDGSAPVE